MGIYYKVNICQKLREAGYTSYNLQGKGILNSAGWTRLQKQQLISWDTLDKVCTILQVQPGELFGYREDEGKLFGIK